MIRLLESTLKGSVERKLESFSKITYQYCFDNFGAEERSKRENLKHANYMQIRKGRLRVELRGFKKGWKMTNEEQKGGLIVLMDDIGRL